MKTRTRFAPSPTGYMHIGNLRTALYEYLIAKAQGGDFLLRIEDTDQKRYVEGATDIIYNTLKMVGMNWDEGPDIGGDFGPYVQSERKDIYAPYAHKLVELGGAHYCFCGEREKQFDEEGNEIICKQEDPCKKISLEEARKRIANGESFVIRQTINQKGKSKYEDKVYGTIEIDYDELDEGVLLKSDGFPTYNFANVIDDHLMGITHVVRGSEYLPSTPKYNLMYDTFGFKRPIYVHLPPVMKDAQHKLSKRNGDASFQDLLAKGYLPEAIINYIALLGWNPGTEEEIFSINDLEKIFSVERLNKSPAIFDIVKLTWMNGVYIRNLSEEDFYKYAEPYFAELPSNIDKKVLARALQPRIETFAQIADQIAFVKELPDYSIELFINKKMKTDVEVAKKALPLIKDVLQNQTEWNNDALFTSLKSLAEANEMKNGQVLYPARIAFSGLETTPGGATELAVVLGKEECLKRIDTAIKKLA